MPHPDFTSHRPVPATSPTLHGATSTASIHWPSLASRDITRLVEDDIQPDTSHLPAYHTTQALKLLEWPVLARLLPTRPGTNYHILRSELDALPRDRANHNVEDSIEVRNSDSRERKTLIQSYLQRVHIWFPVLHQDLLWALFYTRDVENDKISSSSRCILSLAYALAAEAEAMESSDPGKERSPSRHRCPLLRCNSKRHS